MSAKRSGKLDYTKRGFQMDAEDAMQGDVVRALIELITNADDAYDAKGCLLYTSPSPRDLSTSRMPSSA